jgi:ribose-phosphate pyrophosphokinase
VIGPDAESLPWVSDLAGRLHLSHAVGSKVRRGDRSVAIEFQDTTQIAGRPVLIVDDIVSSGGTIIACAKALAAAGATAIDAVVTHALFPDDVCREMLESGIRSIRSTHSVPHSTNAIVLDGLLAAALKSEIAEARQ